MTISMGFSCEDGVVDRKESQIPRTDEVGNTGCSATGGHGHGVELDVEFKPIEHPLEPLDEDRPVKCPIPNSSVLNDEGTRKERTAESLRKRAESSAATEYGMVMVAAQPPVQAVRKRHHALTRNQSAPPSFRSPQSNVLQILQEYNEFKS
ncbi:uncharacterized protein LOC143877838 [Tasmannia lanceolata]|uniref:uncharacterized protein LOC143877838 n=1 Tax=Tasmannia lanceolata TaxID=3420 RepID=UPI004063CFFE